MQTNFLEFVAAKLNQNLGFVPIFIHLYGQKIRI